MPLSLSATAGDAACHSCLRQTAPGCSFTQALSVWRVPACDRFSFTHHPWTYTPKMEVLFGKDRAGEGERLWEMAVLIPDTPERPS